MALKSVVLFVPNFGTPGGPPAPTKGFFVEHVSQSRYHSFQVIKFSHPWLILELKNVFIIRTGPSSGPFLVALGNGLLRRQNPEQ